MQSKMQESMGKIKYDVVIPSASRDISFLPRVISHINKNFDNVGTIYVLTAKININKLSVKGQTNVIVLDENTLLDGLTFSSVASRLEKFGYKSKTGWYFQQFLKYAFALSPYASEYYLTWDSDTIPLRNIPFFSNGKPLFTMKKEYNPSYFTTIKSLFNVDKLTDFSFIAEHMVFKTEIVKEMLSFIMSTNMEGDTWMDKILNAGDYTMEYPPFSEFETYGTYCYLKHPNFYDTRTLSTLRCAGYMRGRQIPEKMLNELALDLDTASFEVYHGPIFPFNYVAIYYRFLSKWNKIKRRFKSCNQ